ncbi:NAD(P)/FAD-dependent oxidoreductase [Amycolatopsis sp. NBC_00345]|uniref:FAD-binding protein n=1 Tax=Amycolatopsis sp. NBC_00345 TaxID=2975955 RepID=UPI002E25369F
MSDTNTTPVRTDAVVIGGGPAGLFAALTLVRAGRRVALLEAGGDMRESLCPRLVARMDGRSVRDAEKFRLQCPRCTCLTGLGGAAFHFDTNLGYISSLTRSKIESAPDGTVRSYSGLERALGSFDRAQELIAEAYRIFYELGLPPAEPAEPGDDPSFGSMFQHVDTALSQSVTVDDSLVVIAGLKAELEANGGRVLLHHRAEDIEPLDGGGFEVRAATPDGPAVFHAEDVVVGVGKLGLPWVRELVGRIGVRHRPSRRVDLGVRLEARREDLDLLLNGCHNPKLSFLNGEGHSVRTFCVCGGGRVMQYGFLDAVALDGQHCLNQPTTKSNMGVLTTVDLPEGVDGTEYAAAFAARVADYGGGRPVVSTVDQLAGRGVPAGPLTTSLINYHHGDLRECLPPSLVRDVLAMVERLNALHPGLVPGTATVAAPVIERIFPDLDLSGDLESSVPGLYFVGDSSSKIIGITYGAATGMAAARSVLRRRAGLATVTGGDR